MELAIGDTVYIIYEKMLDGMEAEGKLNDAYLSARQSEIGPASAFLGVVVGAYLGQPDGAVKKHINRYAYIYQIKWGEHPCDPDEFGNYTFLHAYFEEGHKVLPKKALKRKVLLIRSNSGL